MRIVCGTDFSPRAMQAAEAAALLAARLGDDLLLVHVAETLGAAEAIAAGAYADQRRALDRQADALRATGVHVAAELATTPLHLLLDERAANDARILVVGASGAGARASLLGALLGRTAERAAQSAPVPVLVVRDAAPLQRWAGGAHKLRALLACDRTAASDAALQRGAALLAAAPADAVAVFVVDGAAERQRFGVADEADLVALLRRDLAERCASVGLAANARVIVGGEPVRALLDAADAEHAELIVVGAHQRGAVARAWRRSVAAGVLRHGATNVLVVPARAAGASTGLDAPRLRTVLAALDLEAGGDLAAAYAYAIVEQDGVVHLAHVHVPARAAARVVPASVREALAARARDDAATEVHALVGDDAAEALRALAERIGADAICIAARRDGILPAGPLGSVTRALIGGTRRPVLVVRPPAP